MMTPLEKLTRGVLAAALAAVVVYGTLAGYRSMDDPDMWWQMASGRYMLESGHVMRTEVFSYTAKGQPWTYPVGACLLFYKLWTLGGATLLSLLSPAVCGAIALLLVWRGGITRGVMAALAVPSVAFSTLVRANMFSTLLAAIYLKILWDVLRRRAEEKTPRTIWILPALMLVWVNLHPGFIYGLALVFGFAMVRPHRLLPCASLTLLATLVNPWTWQIYGAILAQGGVMSAHSQFINEWKRTAVSWAVARDWLNLAEADNHLWWLMALALAGAVVGFFRRRRFSAGVWGGLLLIGSAAGAILYTRFYGISAIAAAIVGPELLDFGDHQRAVPKTKNYATLAASALLIAAVAWQSSAYITDRYNHTHLTLAHFGAGESYWLPERAAAFIEANHLPREIYADYALGGFLLWRLGPRADGRAGRYPVFIDGRAIPYGLDLFFQQMNMTAETLDRPDWQMAIDGWNVRTVVMSVDRFVGYRGTRFDKMCDSPLFKMVYLDDKAAVFVKSTDVTTPAMNCSTVKLAPPPCSTSKTQRYHFWMSAGTLYLSLKRGPEAIDALDHARVLFDGDPTWYQAYAAALGSQAKFADAETYARKAIAMRPAPITYDTLAGILKAQQRYDEAMEAYAQGAARSGSDAWDEWIPYADTALLAGRPQAAYDAADRILAESPFHGEAETMGRGLVARCLTLQGMALVQMLRPNDAIAVLGQAMHIADTDPKVQGPLLVATADANWQIGNREAALAAFRQAQVFGMEEGAAARTMVRLKQQMAAFGVK